MNERIRGLLEQAGYKPLPGFDFANELQEVFLEKFAELIVRECAEQVDDYYIEFYNRSAAEKIREHFGLGE